MQQDNALLAATSVASNPPMLLVAGASVPASHMHPVEVPHAARCQTINAIDAARCQTINLPIFKITHHDPRTMGLSNNHHWAASQ
jgi:hypothetical protein